MAKKTYSVRGEVETVGESFLPLDEGQAQVSQSVQLDAAVRADSPLSEIEIADDDLLEVELEDGFVLWTTIDRLQADTAEAEAERRSAEGTELLLPATYPADLEGVERGRIKNLLKALKIVKVDVPGLAAGLAAKKIESKLQGEGQVFRVDEQGALQRDQIVAHGDPSLLLIHGTFSSTTNAYSGFFNETRPVWKQIFDHYEGRVFGFEHATLSKSPVENAIDLLKVLPRESKLHVVSHSRGGLVGDLLAHGGLKDDAFSKESLDRELRHSYGAKEARDAARDRYQELNELLRDRAPRVERYVRAACPAAGTSFAAKRLDVYMSILIHLIKQIPAFGPVLGAVGEFAAAVVKKRADPEELPGLEAQMPKSSFQRLLNESAHTLESDLTVLAGDSNGFPKNLANLFFWKSNDLVVDTKSMYAGAHRARRLWYLESSKQVTHMNYFSRVETAEVVRRGLLRPGSEAAGFQSQIPAGVERGHVDHAEPDEKTGQTCVILLPGIMGSHLSVIKGDKRERIWLDKSDLIKGRGKQLRLGANTVEPDGVLKRGYDNFRDYLAKSQLHVIPVPYDWRLTLNKAAKRLDEMVSSRLQHSDQPIHLLAHSMGGVVASLFMVNHANSWKRLRDSGGRLVQVGTPNRGSYVMPRIAQGKEKMIRVLAALDLDLTRQEWAEMASEFPGVLELSPQFGGPDFWDQQTWSLAGVASPPKQTALDKAKKTAELVAAQQSRLAGEGVIYVAGGPKKTPVWDDGWKSIVWTQRGDGRVTWDSGIPEGAPLWFIPDAHGSLLDHKKSFPGLEDLILHGSTTRLKSELPAVSSALSRSAPASAPRLAEEDEIEMIPTRDDLVEAALGMDELHGRVESSAPEPSPCRVSVVHGDLSYTQNPVLVGHYRGDSIVHAEKALDYCLAGALSARQQLGIYPGAVGTAEAVLHSGGSASSPGPAGAIVVGLGNVGELAPGALTRSVEKGLLRYGQACRDNGLDTSSIKISSLLVGSGEAGLTVSQIIESFLLAVDNANRALDKLASAQANGQGSVPGEKSPIFISHLEFIELYQDVALEALHQLVSAASRSQIQAEPQLVRRTGGRFRPRSMSPSGWWTRLSIQVAQGQTVSTGAVGKSHHKLEFTAYSDRARASQSSVHVQTKLVDRMLTDVVASSGRGADQLPETLFELLLPPGFKDAAADGRDLQLVLDPAAAAYPWELLIDRKSKRNPSGSGLLRQLSVVDPPVVSHSEINTILVVGDPKSALVPLPGARREAETIADKFSARPQWDVISQIRNETGPPGISATSITNALLANDVRILHLAGHGHYEKGDPLLSGMVLSGNPGDAANPAVMLTPAEVRQMRLQPELVFINCCHLGYIEKTPEFYKLASNLAAQFIKSGVKAVVAAGWPVDDDAAVTFSERFYTELLNGEDFGNAVKRARRNTHDSHPGSNTWGAYQCYGDPGFRLMMDREVRSRVTRRYYDASDYLDVSELVVELENLVSRAKVEKTKAQREALSERLRQLWSVVTRKSWESEAGVIVGFAMVEGEVGSFGEAIFNLERAMKLERGGLTLTHFEQLASFRTKLGKEKGSRSEVGRAVRELENLIKNFGATSERSSLLAAAHKRIVQIGLVQGSDASRRAARKSLRKMIQGYIQAEELGVETSWYPASNALLGVVLLGGPIDNAPKKGSPLAEIEWAVQGNFQAKVDEVDVNLQNRGLKDFWEVVARTDLAMVRSLSKGSIEKEAVAIAADYKAAMKLFGSEREVGSVLNQISFAETAVREFWPNGKRKTTSLQGLAALQKALEQS